MKRLDCRPRLGLSFVEINILTDAGKTGLLAAAEIAVCGPEQPATPFDRLAVDVCGRLFFFEGRVMTKSQHQFDRLSKHAGAGDVQRRVASHWPRLPLSAKVCHSLPPSAITCQVLTVFGWFLAMFIRGRFAARFEVLVQKQFPVCCSGVARNASGGELVLEKRAEGPQPPATDCHIDSG